jgi:hypothetical protein
MKSRVDGLFSPLARRAFTLFVGGTALTGAVACGAVYPEITAPTRPAPAGEELTPPPPEDMLYIAFERAIIPPRTRDGRTWSSGGSGGPDSFAQVFVNEAELFRTPVQSDALQPTWPDQDRTNYRIPFDAAVRIELWDSGALNDKPICIKNVRRLHEQASPEPIEIVCDSGARIIVRIAPARAALGLGFSYELRTGSVYVTRVVAESPASRAGLQPGDEIVSIEGKKVADMEEGEPKSLINANARMGLELVVRGDEGERQVSLKDGPIYPVASDGVPLG